MCHNAIMKKDKSSNKQVSVKPLGKPAKRPKRVLKMPPPVPGKGKPNDDCK